MGMTRKKAVIVKIAANCQKEVFAFLNACEGQVEPAALYAAFPQFKKNTVAKARSRWVEKRKRPSAPVITADLLNSPDKVTVEFLDAALMEEFKVATGKAKMDILRYMMELLKYKFPIAKTVEESDEMNKLIEALQSDRLQETSDLAAE